MVESVCSCVDVRFDLSLISRPQSDLSQFFLCSTSGLEAKCLGQNQSKAGSAQGRCNCLDGCRCRPLVVDYLTICASMRRSCFHLSDNLIGLSLAKF